MPLLNVLTAEWDLPNYILIIYELNGPIRFVLLALGVVAYLFGVSFFTTFHEPPAPKSIRPLSSA